MNSLGRADGRPRRRWGRVALAAGLVATAFGTAAPSPRVEASPTDIVAFVIEGTGFGHGRGLSQWGAYGYAVDHGWTYDRILNHYYGGTVGDDTPSNQRIRVRLTDYDGRGTVTVISRQTNGVQWNGRSGPAMRAVERSGQPGVFDIEVGGSATCSAGAAQLVVPDGPITRPPWPAPYSSDAEDIQRFIARFGVPANGSDPGSIAIDGRYGPQTSGFIGAWQASQGLPVNGDRWDADDAARARQIIAADASATTWTRIGTHTQSPGSPVRFTTPGGDSQSTDPGQVLGVCSSTGRVTHYRGAIEVVDTENGNRVANDVPVEQYLRGVVPKEISALWANADHVGNDNAGRHAVQAQSVAARSYGLSEDRTGNHYEYRNSSVQYATTCDTTSCQVYAGSATRSSAGGSASAVEHPLTDAAIQATAREVRYWPGDGPGDRPVRTEFSASNGPRTAGGQFPPVDDIGDDTALNPNHRWTRILDADDFAAQHGLGRITSVEMVESQVYGSFGFDGIWFDDVLVRGTNGTYREDAWDFRNAYGLRSPGFTIRPITRSASAADIAFIGDSVGVSIAGDASSEFQRLTDGTFPTRLVDVVGGRCTTRSACLGSTGVEVAESLPDGLDLVVVELGYNDNPATFAADIDAMMSALTARGVRDVAWVNMADIRTSGGRSVYGPANAALEAATSRWPTLRILDWDAASDVAERVRWFSDGVHLTATGQAEFALWLRNEVLDVVPSHYVGARRTVRVPVVGAEVDGLGGAPLVVPDGAVAAALNVTVVGPADRGYVTVWPCADERPVISNLNYVGGMVRANAVIAPISADGEVCLFTKAGTHLIVDVAGWFGDGFVGLEPERRVDTRSAVGAPAGPLAAATPLRIPVAGTDATTIAGAPTSIPADVAAVAVNVAAIDPVARGYLTVWPCGTEQPLASNVNYAAGDLVSTGVIAPVGADGSICLVSNTPTQVLVDLMGYIESGAGFEPAQPTRLVDTRAEDARIGAGQVLEVPIHDRLVAAPDDPSVPVPIPATANAVALNVAAAGVVEQGFLTVWPCTDPMPVASNLNYRDPNAATSNSVVAPIGPDGSICIYARRAIDVVVDVSGWFEGSLFRSAVPERLVDTRFAIGPRAD